MLREIGCCFDYGLHGWLFGCLRGDVVKLFASFCLFVTA